MKIDIENLSFGYGETGFRLDIPNLSIEDGASFALVGPSGCGKSTFLHLISALLKPNTGTVSVGGVDVAGLSDRKARAFRAAKTGYVFQDFALVSYLTAQDNILYPLYAAGRSPTKDQRAEAARLAQGCGVEHVLNRKPQRLSQGEKQRIAVCRALMNRPKLLLADEPTGNLDPANKVAIMDHLFEYATASGATLIVVTHDTNLTKRFGEVADFSEYSHTVEAGAQ